MQEKPLVALGCLLIASTCFAQKTNWVQVNTTNTPGPRWAHGNAFDFLRGRAIVFGGGDSNNKGDDTWEYDGSDWTLKTPSTKPPGRRLTAMAYHLAQVRTIMFGGSGISVSYLNDTWAWDGNNWTQLSPASSPSGRWGHGMAYDSARRRTVLLGGLGTTLLNDTWEWDGTNWTQITTATSPPVGVYGGALAYDAARKKVVLFGGSTASADTWEYDGTNWTKATPVQSATARAYACLDYDSARQRVVMFGGLSGTLLNDTWEYDGTTWTQAMTSAAPAGRRDYDLMVYDPGRRKIIVYGGLSSSGRMSDTWEYGESTLAATPSTVSAITGGRQSFALDAGAAHANRLYWVFGSITGTTPGVNLGSINLPLNLDAYTELTILFPNSPVFANTMGALDGTGQAAAAFNCPALGSGAIGLKLYHAFLVYDLQNRYYLASNPVTLTLVQ